MSDEFVMNALNHMHTQWHVPSVGMTEGSRMLNIKLATLKARLARNQLCITKSSENDAPAFTGYDLVHTLITDQLAMYGFAHDAIVAADVAHIYADWSFENILSTPYKRRHAILQVSRGLDGKPDVVLYGDGKITKFTRDASLVLPLGGMVLWLACSFYARSGNDKVYDEMIAHIAPSLAAR